MIIGKKQIILTGLTLLLGIAVYVSYIGSVNNGVKTGDELLGDKGNYGEAQFVGKTGVDDSVNSDNDEFFAQARIDKKKSRDQAVEVLQSVYGGGDLTQEQLAVISQDTQKLGSLIESETKIENMLKAQGFTDVLCYLNGESANIIVKVDTLEKAQAAQIKSAILSEVEVSAENITIVEVK